MGDFSAAGWISLRQLLRGQVVLERDHRLLDPLPVILNPVDLLPHRLVLARILYLHTLRRRILIIGGGCTQLLEHKVMVVSSLLLLRSLDGPAVPAATIRSYGMTSTAPGGNIPRRGHLCNDLLAAVVVIVVGIVVGASVVMSRSEETVLRRSEAIALQISAIIV